MTRLRVGAVLVAVLVVLAALAPVIAPYDPFAIGSESGASAPPSWAHPLGTDAVSRDLLSRVLYGARVSLAVGVLAIAIAVTVGTGVGLAAGYAGGVVDAVLMRVVDAGLAVPRVFLLLVVLVLWEHVSIPALIVVLGCTSWFATSRLVRAEVLSARGREWVAAARAAGAGPLRVIGRHLLPNVAGPVIVVATLGVGQVILIEAGLSFLGVGVPAPHPSWGSIIADGRHVLPTAPWISTGAGCAVVITVLAFSVLGEGLRETLAARRG